MQTRHFHAILAGLMATGLAACCFHFGVEGNGVPGSETIVVGSIERVTVTGSLDVAVVVNPALDGPAVVYVNGDENLLGYLDARGGATELVLELEESIDPDLPFEVIVETPALCGLRVMGSGNIAASGVDAGAFKVGIEGSGDVRVSGQVGVLEARVSGSGDLDARGLQALDAEVLIQGSGDVRVCAARSVVGAIEGSGDVAYGCGPATVDVDVWGSGDVSRGGW